MKSKTASRPKTHRFLTRIRRGRFDATIWMEVGLPLTDTDIRLAREELKRLEQRTRSAGGQRQFVKYAFDMARKAMYTTLRKIRIAEGKHGN